MVLNREIFLKLPNEYKALALKLSLLGVINIDFGGKENGK